MTRDVSIGRSAGNDIVLGESCMYASGQHAIIYSDGAKLFYKDISTNGTVINGIKVNHENKQIFCGDEILLSGKYLLKWDEIYKFFPSIVNSQSKKTYVNMDTEPKHVVQADHQPERKISQPSVNYIEYEGESAIGFLIAIYIFALLGGVLGIILGIVVYSSKTTYDGRRVSKYKESHRTAALIGSILALVMLIVYITSKITL